MRKPAANSEYFKPLMALIVLAVVFVSLLLPSVSCLDPSFFATELLCKPTNDSVSINVVPNSDGQIYFECGKVSGTFTNRSETSILNNGIPTTVVLQGLEVNTQYYYRMVASTDGANWVRGVEHSFHTQRSPGNTFIFTVTSDSHVNIQLGVASIWQQTMINVANDHPDFEIDCGDTFAMDNVNTVSGAEQAYLYQRQFFGLSGSSTSTFLALGNHEEQEGWHLDDTGSPATSKPVLGVNAQKKYFPNPVPNGFYSGNLDTYSFVSGDHLREDYYAWTWGDALFVVIDPYWYSTTKPFVGNLGGGEVSDVGSGNRWDWTLGLQQFKWLNQTLQNSAAKYKFIFSHHMTGGADDYGGRGGAVPANLVEWGGYNVGGATWGWDTNRPVDQWGSKPVEQIMMDNNVTVFFHGHDHQYAYEKRDGIVYQSIPSGGFGGNGFSSYSEGIYTLKVLPNPGHLRVTVALTQVTVDYITSAPNQLANGQVAYSYTIPSSTNTPTPTPNSQPTPTTPPNPTPTATYYSSPVVTNSPKPSTQKPTGSSTSSQTPSSTPTIIEFHTVAPIMVLCIIIIFSVAIRKRRRLENLIGDRQE